MPHGAQRESTIWVSNFSPTRYSLSDEIPLACKLTAQCYSANDSHMTETAISELAAPVDTPESAPTPSSAQEEQLLYARDRITPRMISEYMLWFVNRRDFYIQNSYLLLADLETGAGCMKVSAPLTADHVRRHLCGQHTIGLYAVNPETNSCKWFALDVDDDDEKPHLKEIAEEMKLDGLHPAFEESRRGAHLWILCDEPLPAKACRIYLYTLLDRLGYVISGVRKNKEGYEIFPKQEQLKVGMYGNGLRGPFGIHRKSMKRYWFRDAGPTLEEQFAYVRSLPRLRRADLEMLIQDMTMPEDLLPKPVPVFTGTVNPLDKFDIRLYTEKPRRVFSAGDYFVRCPSCAEAGTDTKQDNLHVTPDGSVYKFFCHKGCSFKDIRDACYRRNGRPHNTSSRRFD